MSFGFVGIDAANSTGYCVLLDGEILLTGQCPLLDLRKHLCIGHFTGPTWVIAIEKPFFGLKQGAGQAINHAENCGYAVAVASEAFPDASEIWRPLSKTWRALIPGMPQSPAQLCKKYAFNVADAAGARVRGERGGAMLDSAEAYCIAIACGVWFHSRRK